MKVETRFAPSAPTDIAWDTALAKARRSDGAEEIASLGRWWLDKDAGRIALSPVAARLLEVEQTTSIDSCLFNVKAEDLPQLQTALIAIAQGEPGVQCEFRVVGMGQRIRWLRLQPVLADACGITAGMLTDITFVKHAAMRKKAHFALTQYLAGADTVDEAVVKIIQLVCQELGWEWGAFWAVEPRPGEIDVLSCRYSWHAPEHALSLFEHSSETVVFAPGEGLIGKVWVSGNARWIDDVRSDPDFKRTDVASACGLQSAYFFPVTFMGADGCLRNPGVLEFFSAEPRQREAQLPGLAESISALIAQTVQRLTEQEGVRVLAQTDELTGLLNRRHFHHVLDLACSRNLPGQSFGVMFVDLDHFKQINDAFGHEAGNLVLTDFAKRLTGIVPPGWRIGRLGGDEFAIISVPGTNRSEIDQIAEHVLHAARTRFLYREHELAVSASIGISMFPQHGSSTPEMLHAADAAMYLSKRNGRDLSSHFDGEGSRQQVEMANQLTLMSELHYALARNEFFLDYQPIFDNSGEHVVAAEALIRWRKASGEIVPPHVFIPIAEQSRFIVQLGRWVVEQVCRDLPHMQAAGLPELCVHVNMAAPEFLDPGLPRDLLAIATAANIKPRHICLELTEGVVMKHLNKSLPIMLELHSLGFEISLDDFGMGYSSLSMLKKLPITSLKIDRLFMAGVPDDRDDCAIVRTILDLGRNMKIRVIAEGVENDAQLGFLRQFGCTSIQGYLLGRPMPLARLVLLPAPPVKARAFRIGAEEFPPATPPAAQSSPEPQ
jgi:diguanylate cyclase (GGDEF)-like protein